MLCYQTNREQSTVLRTERLLLRMADPADSLDCQEIIRIYNDPHAGLGGNVSVNIKTIADVQQKHKTHGPKPEFCKLTRPPRGMYFMAYLPNSETDRTGERGTLIGHLAMSFRPEMPYPDINYALFAAYEGFGYASEAGRAVLHFWRDVVGVKEIFCGALADNARSQRTAERIGFVKAGTFDISFGHPPNEKHATGVAFVLPGMEWKEGQTIRPTIGVETNTANIGLNGPP